MAQIDWNKYEREGDFEPETVKACLSELQSQRYKKTAGKAEITFWIDGDDGQLPTKSAMGKSDAKYIIADLLGVLSGEHHSKFSSDITVEPTHDGGNKITLSSAELLGLLAKNQVNFSGSSDYLEKEVG